MFILPLELVRAVAAVVRRRGLKLDFIEDNGPLSVQYLSVTARQMTSRDLEQRYVEEALFVGSCYVQSVLKDAMVFRRIGIVRITCKEHSGYRLICA